MITKMKKLTFLIYYKEYEAFLKRMQELGYCTCKLHRRVP